MISKLGYRPTVVRDTMVDEDWLDTWRPQVSPGKVTLTSRLSGPAAGPRPSVAPNTRVQREAISDAHKETRQANMRRWQDAAFLGLDEPVRDKKTLDGPEVHTLASRGVAGSGGRLPYLDRIQAAFGAHHISGVRAHIGGPAAQAASEIGARAYTTGEDVAFASAPDLRLAAHEAAHVVQQRSGVQLAGGVGHASDAYEQHADAVADAVVRGESAEALLEQCASDGGHAVQRAVQRDGDETEGGERASSESDEWAAGTLLSTRTETSRREDGFSMYTLEQRRVRRTSESPEASRRSGGWTRDLDVDSERLHAEADYCGRRVNMRVALDAEWPSWPALLQPASNLFDLPSMPGLDDYSILNGPLRLNGELIITVPGAFQVESAPMLNVDRYGLTTGGGSIRLTTPSVQTDFDAMGDFRARTFDASLDVLIPALRSQAHVEYSTGNEEREINGGLRFWPFELPVAGSVEFGHHRIGPVSGYRVAFRVLSLEFPEARSVPEDTCYEPPLPQPRPQYELEERCVRIQDYEYEYETYHRSVFLYFHHDSATFITDEPPQDTRRARRRRARRRSEEDDAYLDTVRERHNQQLELLEMLINEHYLVESVIGFTSPEGTREPEGRFGGNQALSQRRAEAAMALLDELVASFVESESSTEEDARVRGLAELYGGEEEELHGAQLRENVIANFAANRETAERAHADLVSEPATTQEIYPLLRRARVDLVRTKPVPVPVAILKGQKAHERWLQEERERERGEPADTHPSSNPRTGDH